MYSEAWRHHFPLYSVRYPARAQQISAHWGSWTYWLYKSPQPGSSYKQHPTCSGYQTFGNHERFAKSRKHRWAKFLEGKRGNTGKATWLSALPPDACLFVPIVLFLLPLCSSDPLCCYVTHVPLNALAEPPVQLHNLFRKATHHRTHKVVLSARHLSWRGPPPTPAAAYSSCSMPFISEPVPSHQVSIHRSGASSETLWR